MLVLESAGSVSGTAISSSARSALSAPSATAVLVAPAALAVLVAVLR